MVFRWSWSGLCKKILYCFCSIWTSFKIEQPVCGAQYKVNLLWGFSTLGCVIKTSETIDWCLHKVDHLLQEKLTHLPPVDGAEYYLQPVQQHPDQSSGGAPPLPAKPWSKPPDASLPSAKPPSPPRRKSVSESSQGFKKFSKNVCVFLRWTAAERHLIPLSGHYGMCYKFVVQESEICVAHVCTIMNTNLLMLEDALYGCASVS